MREVDTRDGVNVMRSLTLTPFLCHISLLRCLHIVISSDRRESRNLICNDLCQPPKVDNQAKTNYSVPRKHPDRVMISDPGIGHSDIRGFGFLLTNRSMVRRERHRLLAWITVSCVNPDLFVDRSNLDKTITLSRCFPWLCTANLVWINALMQHFLSSFPR